MQAVHLGGLKRGIDRTVTRGAQAGTGLYDLVNAYVTISGSVKKRPPFKKVAQLDASTRGLFGNNAKLRTFYSGAVLTSPLPGTIEYDALQPPPAAVTGDTPPVLKSVWFDALYLGRQYVIAAFDDGTDYHYWLQSDGSAAAWQANHAYNVNAVVQPTTPNGFYYTIGNSDFPQAWLPSTKYSVGDVVVPTTLNGWKYTCVDAVGDSPSSGTTEPTWPASDGATVTEEHDESSSTTQPPAVPPSNPGGDRYNNPSGAGITGGSAGTGIVRP